MKASREAGARQPAQARAPSRGRANQCAGVAACVVRARDEDVPEDAPPLKQEAAGCVDSCNGRTRGPPQTALSAVLFVRAGRRSRPRKRHRTHGRVRQLRLTQEHSSGLVEAALPQEVENVDVKPGSARARGRSARGVRQQPLRTHAHLIRLPAAARRARRVRGLRHVAARASTRLRRVHARLGAPAPRVRCSAAWCQHPHGLLSGARVLAKGCAGGAHPVERTPSPSVW